MSSETDPAPIDVGDVDIERLVEWLPSSDVTYFKLRVGDVELVYSKGSTPVVDWGHGTASAQRSSPPPVRAAESPPEPLAESAVEPRGPITGAAPRAAGMADHTTATMVRAPMVGIFHRAPMPGSPPYVSPGDRVTAESTVGLIESMKIFTAVTAGVAGEVDDVVAANGQAVERGEALLTVIAEVPHDVS